MHDDKAHAPSPADHDRRRHDPRFVRTREAILSAGFSLFAVHQPDGVSMDELVRAAGVSKQSFYNHFADKDDLARHILEVSRTELDQLVAEANRGVTDPAQRLAVGLCVLVRQSLDRPERGWVIARLGGHAMAQDIELNEGLAADVRVGVVEGRFACFSPQTGIAFVIGAAFSLAWRVLLDGTEEKAVVLTQQFITLILRAFGLSPIEAEVIASQATERVVRK